MLSIHNPTFVWFENVFFFSQWGLCLVMLFYVPQRKDPSSARTWLLLIFLVPWLGFLLYLLLGRAYMPRKRLRIQRKASDRIRRAQAELHEKGADAPEDSMGPTIGLISRMGEFDVKRGNAIELIPDYDESIAALIADIETAEHNVHLLYYIFEDDSVGHAVGDALCRAVQRGVTCRVLMDSIGSSRALKRLAPKLRHAGVKVLEMLPVGLIRSRTVRFDLRNHRKIAIIDGRVGYLGSQNIIRAGLVDGIVNEELVARVRGPILSQLQMVFLADWYLETDVRVPAATLAAEQPECGDTRAQLLPSGPGYGRANFQMAMVSLIHGASKRVVIATPYFVPDQPLLQALETAVLRGVDVRLVLSAKSDLRLVTMAQQSYYDQLLRIGVKIHLYQPRFLHAKFMTVDESVAVIGSSNVDIRSFALNSEISLLAYDAQVVASMVQIQGHYFGKSRLLTAREWGRRPATRRALQSIARLADSLL